MRRVSRARSGRLIVDVPVASAARSSARFVIDFDPGSVTTACTGAVAWGAGQAPVPVLVGVTRAMGSFRGQLRRLLLDFAACLLTLAACLAACLRA
jgi:hypothetical protein